jgi:hypothetical protein
VADEEIDIRDREHAGAARLREVEKAILRRISELRS